MGNLRFDALQRYKTVMEICNRAGIEEEDSVLDVGGGTGGLGSLIRTRKYITADLLGGGSSHVTASMVGLPFADEVFDFALQVDALEHVPPAVRERSLQEMARVSRDYVIWMGPVHHSETIRVEENLCNLHRTLMDGREMNWLAEHRTHGLPQLDTVLDTLAEACVDWVFWKSASLSRWWALSRLDLELEAGLYQPTLTESVNDWYSTSGWKEDYRVTGKALSYRRVFVGRKKGPLPSDIDQPIETGPDDWETATTVIEAVARSSSLSPEGDSFDPETLRVLEKCAEILSEQRTASSLFSKWFGKNK